MFSDTLARKISPLGQSRLLLPSVEMTRTVCIFRDPFDCAEKQGSRKSQRAKRARFLGKGGAAAKAEPCGAAARRAGKARADAGSSPVTSTKNRRSAFAGLRFFAVQPGLSVRTFGPKPNALSRKGSRKNRAASFVGRGGAGIKALPRQKEGQAKFALLRRVSDRSRA